MKKEEKLQSKPDKPKEEIVIDYNKPMQAYQVRVEHREGKDHLIVCVAKIGKHKMTVDELAVIVNSLATEMRTGFKSVREDISKLDARVTALGTRMDQNGLKPLQE